MLIVSGQTLKPLERIPVRQAAQYDTKNNLEFFPAIVGGIPAKLGEFSAHVSIQKRSNGNHICGGTLIDVDYVITSAHCVSNALGVVDQAENVRVHIVLQLCKQSE